MLDSTQLDTAKKLCELLLWQYPDQVDSCFAELQDYLGDDMTLTLLLECL